MGVTFKKMFQMHMLYGDYCSSGSNRFYLRYINDLQKTAGYP